MIQVAFINGNKEATSSPVYQWDYGRWLQIYGLETTDTVIQVHFSDRSCERTEVRLATLTDDYYKVSIPDVLLENSYSINVFVYMVTKDSGNTTHHITIPVIARKKPASFISSPDPTQTTILENALIEMNATMKNFVSETTDSQEKFIAETTAAQEEFIAETKTELTNKAAWIEQDNTPNKSTYITLGSTYMIKTETQELLDRIKIEVTTHFNKANGSYDTHKIQIPLILDEFTKECRFRVFEKPKYYFGTAYDLGDTITEESHFYLYVNYEINGERKYISIGGKDLGLDDYFIQGGYVGTTIDKVRFYPYQVSNFTWYLSNEQPTTFVVVDKAYVDRAIEEAIKNL